MAHPTNKDLCALVDDATPETLPDLIRDLEAAKARALARVATWAAAPRNPELEPVTALEEIVKTARVRRPGWSASPDPEANHAPSAGGMFSCMVASAIMLVLYLVLFLVLRS